MTPLLMQVLHHTSNLLLREGSILNDQGGCELPPSEGSILNDQGVCELPPSDLGVLMNPPFCSSDGRNSEDKLIPFVQINMHFEF